MSQRGIDCVCWPCPSCAPAPAHMPGGRRTPTVRQHFGVFLCRLVCTQDRALSGGLEPTHSGHGPAPACGLCCGPHPSLVNFACCSCPCAVSSEVSTHLHQVGTLCSCLCCVCLALPLHSFLCRPTPESVFSTARAALREAWCVLLLPGPLAYTSFVEWTACMLPSCSLLAS